MSDYNVTQGDCKWLYSDVVKDHFLNPRNFISGDVNEKEFDGVGVVGSPACGDMMRVYIKVDRENDRIIDCKWQTFGCASAIASTSVMSEMVLNDGGLKLDEALKITPMDIVKKMGGLPDRKIHCSVLGDQALTKAIEDYRARKTK
jgi:NifU-like protein involved in Fe-S cluster formation